MSNRAFEGGGVLSSHSSRLDIASIVLLLAAIFMNFFLAVVSNTLFSLSSVHVTVVQLAITLGALAVVVLRRPILKDSFAALVFLQMFSSLLAMLLKGAVDFRLLYNLLLTPIFFLLGLGMEGRPSRTIVNVVVVIAFIAVFEAIFPDFYLFFVNPLGYYISTRDWVDSFAEDQGLDSGEGGFYVGANRAGGIVFGLADHRVASIFLEPISLSYFALIVLVFSLYGKGLSSLMRRVVIALAILMIVLSDTRTALALAGLFIVAKGVLVRMDKNIIAVTPFFVYGIAAIAYLVSGGGDQFGDLGYRLSITFDAFSVMTLSEFFLGGGSFEAMNDSGVLSLIGGCGVVGCFAYYYLAAGFSYRSKRNVGYVAASLVFVTLMSFFGGAVFSIKTASLLGFLLGMESRAPTRKIGVESTI